MTEDASRLCSTSRISCARGRPHAPWPALRVLFALAAACLTPASSARADVWAVLAESAASKRVVRINTDTGVVTSPWAGFSVGAFSTGAGAMAASNGHLYFSADGPGESRRRLFAVNLATGALVSNPIIGAPAAAPVEDLLTATPAFIIPRGTTLYGLFTLDASSRCIATIDPASGAVTQLGPAIPAAGFSGGVATYSAPTNLVYFVARDPGGAGPRLFGVSLITGALAASPLIVPPPGFDAEPAFLEADGAGRLLALFRQPGAGWMTLAVLDSDTGIATALGAGFAAGGYSSGVADYAWGAQRLHFAANAPGESQRRLFTVDTATGALVSSPLITSSQGYLTTPILLAAQPVATAAPGTVPDGEVVDGVPLLVTRSGTTLTFTWGPSCSAGATDYTLHTGTLGSYYSHTRTQCTTGGARTTTAAQGTGNRYYLIVPVNGTEEGSYGTASSGAQRPRSTLPCQGTLNTSPCP